jgi:hypothetical protein
MSDQLLTRAGLFKKRGFETPQGMAPFRVTGAAVRRVV